MKKTKKKTTFVYQRDELSERLEELINDLSIVDPMFLSPTHVKQDLEACIESLELLQTHLTMKKKKQ